MNLQYVIYYGTAELGRFYREEHFHAPVQVTRHQVGAAQEHVLITTIAEVEDTRVFQETPHYRGHSDVLAHPFDAGTEAADASDLQVDLDAGLRCPVKRLN